jgi:hypothetical protein
MGLCQGGGGCKLMFAHSLPLFLRGSRLGAPSWVPPPLPHVQGFAPPPTPLRNRGTLGGARKVCTPPLFFPSSPPPLTRVGERARALPSLRAPLRVPPVRAPPPLRAPWVPPDCHVWQGIPPPPASARNRGMLGGARLVRPPFPLFTAPTHAHRTASVGPCSPHPFFPAPVYAPTGYEDAWPSPALPFPAPPPSCTR